MITEKDKALLESLKEQMKTALHSNYARNIGDKKMKELRELWERITGQKYPYSGSCSTCQLRLLQKVGRWYEEYVGNEPMLTVNELEEKDANKDTPKKNSKK